MQNIKKVFSKNLLAVSAAFAVSALALFAAVVIFMPQQTHAQASGANVHGFGWSANMGWISFNSTEGGGSVSYGVNVTVSGTTGTFSGDAWGGQGIGWISFNSADVTSCGPQATINLTTGAISGWARALVGSTAQGWDGCISLSGSNPAFGVTYNSGQTASIGGTALPGGALTGYAWGSVNVGWIGFVNSSGTSFASIDFGSPTVTISANPTTVSSLGGSSTLTWTAQNAASCTASGDWDGSKNASGGTETDVIPHNTTNSPITKTYTITCTGTGGGSATAAATVVVAAASSPSLTFLGNGVANPAVVANDPNGLALTWDVQNIQGNSCIGTSPGNNFTNWNSTHKTSTPNGTYSETISNVTTARSYVMTCTGLDGSTLSQTVNVSLSAPSCAILPAVASISGGTAPLSNAQKIFTVQWYNTGTTFYTTDVLASPGSLAVPSPSHVVPPTPGHQTTISVSTPSVVTTPQTITISGKPISGAPASSCTPAQLNIVPIHDCADPAATNYLGALPCTYASGTGPSGTRPSYEEL